LKVRLSVMMFTQYFIHGATLPILSLYLTRYLHFSGLQAGTVLSMSAVAAFISPLIGAFTADRFIGTPRLYGLCHLAAGALMGVLSYQDRFHPFVLVYLIYMLVFGPTTAISNAITFHHVPDPERNFGGIRVWGTIGWISVAWIFGFFWLRSSEGIVAGRLADALTLSAAASVLLGVYAFTLPAPAAGPYRRSPLFPVEAFRVMIKKEVLRLSAVSFLVSLVDRYYFFGTAPFLRQIGFPESDIMPAMSIGQVPEVFALAFLGTAIARLGLKRVLLLGVLMEIGRFASFAAGGPVWLILTGLSLHGFAYAFFFATIFIYLDRSCGRDTRSGVHQLFAIINSGVGSFLGSLVAGKTLDIFTLPGTVSIDYRAFWSVPLALSVLAFSAVLWFFPKNR
jgi:nucleoside transporter